MMYLKCKTTGQKASPIDERLNQKRGVYDELWDVGRTPTYARQREAGSGGDKKENMLTEVPMVRASVRDVPQIEEGKDSQRLLQISKNITEEMEEPTPRPVGAGQTLQVAVKEEKRISEREQEPSNQIMSIQDESMV
ncbi:hypothetical protein OE88DRAFT_1663669 [Heliocybe sulcata]|uniref:Uncharacterized protein n=1 Tax=Heliocybe sulcata TaxID=5364 RepID=A0A5C3N4C4_9AGAM|nr:hypothetical protein OE88DRAFT_1663669 [Heliocybe sulcata]